MLLSIKAALEKALVFVTSIMLVAMLALALWQVSSRYVFQSPAIYTEETLRFVMIWMGFLGTAYAFGRNQHLRLVFIVERLKGRAKRILLTVNGLIVILFALIILLVGGINMVKSGMGQVSPILNIKMGYVFLILPVSALLIATLQGVNLVLMWKDDGEAKPAGA